MTDTNESTEYFLGKVAAHAWADEMRELMAGYEKLAQGSGLLPPELLQGAENVGQLAKKTVTAPGTTQKLKGWVAPVARGGKLVTPTIK